jgi:hypothetical protein
MGQKEIIIEQSNAQTIEIPKELLWDYKKAPDDLLWRLQRIADFFPVYGRDRETVIGLYENIGKLRMDETTRLLVEEYKKAWEEKGGKDRK